MVSFLALVANFPDRNSAFLSGVIIRATAIARLRLVSSRLPPVCASLARVLLSLSQMVGSAFFGVVGWGCCGERFGLVLAGLVSPCGVEGSSQCQFVVPQESFSQRGIGT